MRSWWGCGLLAAVLIFASASPGQAQWSLTLNDFGAPQTLTDQDATLHAEVLDGRLWISTWQDELPAVSVNLWPPRGDGDLRPGVWDPVGHSLLFTSGLPLLSFQGCSADDGRVELRELEVRGAEVHRLWLLFEGRCGVRPAWGEVRIGLDEPVVRPVPRVLRWGSLDQGRPAQVVPVRLLARERTRFGAARILGEDADAFEVRLDDCADADVPAGVSCDVYVRPREAGPGVHEAVLRIPAAGGETTDVPLQRHVHGGRSLMSITGLSGIWEGVDRTIDVPNDGLFGYGSRWGVGFSGGWADVMFGAGASDSVRPGSFGPFDRDAPGSPRLDVSTGVSYACGWVHQIGLASITEATFSLGEQLRTFSGDFELRCPEPTPSVVRAHVDWRRGDDGPLGAWMLEAPTRHGPVSRLPTAPPQGSPPDAPADGPSLGVVPGPAAVAAVGPTLPASGQAGTLRPASRTETCAGRAWSRAVRVGSDGSDRLGSTGVATLLRGGRGHDLLIGARGGDCLSGGPGNDRLDGRAGADVLLGGTGDDRLRGGPGRDRLDCGPGRRDVAIADRTDTVRGCERVRR